MMRGRIPTKEDIRDRIVGSLVASHYLPARGIHQRIDGLDFTIEKIGAQRFRITTDPDTAEARTFEVKVSIPADWRRA